jgi:predicted secreted hydrolase
MIPLVITFYCSVYHARYLMLEKLESWVSPQSGKEYGTRWRIREQARGMDLEVKARHAQQEIRMFETLSIPLFHFWEGRTAVFGHMDGKAVSGIGYAESVRLSEEPE